MKHGVVIGIGFGLAVAPLLGNGGGYFRGGVENAGDVHGFEPKATENIRILDEKLTVILGAGEADVEVRYLMHNETAKRVTVRFGFPVEESFDGEIGLPEKTVRWQTPHYCKDYRVTANGKAVKAKWQEEKQGSNEAAADPRFKGLVGWWISELTFDGGEEKPVLIRFSSAYSNSSFQVSKNSSVYGSFFRYRLSSGACWAGTIGSGHIVLQPKGIDPRDLKVLKPLNRFHKQGEAWVWDFENLEPTLADDLVIDPVPAVDRIWEDSKSVTYVHRGGDWSMEHHNYKATASSVKPPEGDLNYAVANLNDGDPNNAWCAGKPGPGVGEWLELRPEVAKPLRSLVLLPGYQKSEELFRANARPKRVKVILNDEHTFSADVPDKRARCTIPVPGYAKPVRVVKLIFEEVWPGGKFEDLCVSGVELEVKLDKKPFITPRR